MTPLAGTGNLTLKLMVRALSGVGQVQLYRASTWHCLDYHVRLNPWALHYPNGNLASGKNLGHDRKDVTSDKERV